MIPKHLQPFSKTTRPLSLSGVPRYPHKRSKHFGIEWAIFKESVELKELALVHVSTDKQPVSAKFVEFRDQVMGDAEKQAHFGEKIFAKIIML